MRSALLCVAALVLGSPICAFAQSLSFPYVAVVETNDVPVHCGPGFYATGRLKQGERVTVHRHDPGGWYMISPPAGEFSLVRADAVRIVSPDAAEVIVEETTVRIGSRLTGEYGVEQVPLARGMRVQVVQGITPPAGWLAIAPPRGEYRWILGRFLIPVQESIRSAQDADPFAVPSTASRPETFDAPTTEVKAARPVPEERGPALTLGPLEREPDGPVIADASETLGMLDRELEGLHLFEPTEWPLDELASEYERLKTTSPAMTRQIDVRLVQIGKMRLVKDHYTDYVRLTSATDRRDAALIARHERISSGVVQASEPTSASPQPTLAAPMRLAAKPSSSVTPLPPPAPPAEPAAEDVNPQIQGGPPYATKAAPRMPPSRPVEPLPQTSGPVLLPPVANSQSQGANPSQAPGTGPVGGPQRFDAIGVVQAAVDPHPEAPRYVLVAPDGRILVYLREQPGIPLEKFVGQAMGVDGERHRHPEMTTPMIVVEKLTPVRL